MKALKTHKKLIGRIIFIAFIAVLLISKLSKLSIAKPREIDRAGYKTILDVPGVEFQVKQDLSDYSTAVMEISKNVNFIDYQTYSYKNGKDTYLLFNIRQYIVIVMEGTAFDFEVNGVTESLKSNSMNGIWFAESGKDAILYESSDRYEIEVDAQVVITNAIYNDFHGILTTITRDGKEWSMFAGYAYAAEDGFKDIIEYIAQTFEYTDENLVQRGDYVIAENGLFEEIIEIEEIITPDPTEEPAAAITTQAPVEEIPATTEVPVTTEIPSTPTEQPLIATAAPDASMAPSDTEEIIVVSKDTFELQENQKKYEMNTENVYTSSVYNMLSIGYTGFISTTGDKGNSQNAYVKANKIYNKAETEELIAEYCSSGDSYYTGMTAPEGTHFEAVEYDVNFLTEKEAYVDVRLCGLDGESLRYRGIIYPQKTYDIHNKIVKTGEWNEHYICFYVIPNGCKEYVLKFGDGTPSNSYYFATYYKVETE